MSLSRTTRGAMICRQMADLHWVVHRGEIPLCSRYIAHANANRDVVVQRDARATAIHLLRGGLSPRRQNIAQNIQHKTHIGCSQIKYCFYNSMILLFPTKSSFSLFLLRLPLLLLLSHSCHGIEIDHINFQQYNEF